MNQKNKRRLLLTGGMAAAALCIAGCTTTGPSSGETAAGTADRDRAIDAAVDATLQRLYVSVNGSRELVSKARGVLVFPRVIAAGFWFGAQYGEGALRIDGRTDGYYSTAGGSFGLQIGAQSKVIIYVFLTDDALAQFRRRDGWAAGTDATVAVARLGANGQLDTTTATNPVEVFVLTNAGLMAGVSLEGTKVSRLSP
ncbi:YSC84-related protein [Caballeronia sp. LZ008]|uniref:BPSL1445 family SYLF domain-containing lipoprotein n=1 Tax=unclassified Caballeronia TaxID=2646786 RepID=UPI002027904B|nr:MULTISPECIES: YSC84-related protein [unclassified Caballeronia]MDR5794826.1 YSC84-related protein [Caballeronia sp. LZ008]